MSAYLRRLQRFLKQVGWYRASDPMRREVEAPRSEDVIDARKDCPRANNFVCEDAFDNPAAKSSAGPEGQAPFATDRTVQADSKTDRQLPMATDDRQELGGEG